MRALGHAINVRVPMCSSRVLLEVVSAKGTYGILVPMKKINFLLIYLSSTWNVSFNIKNISTESFYQKPGGNQKLNVKHSITQKHRLNVMII